MVLNFGGVPLYNHGTTSLQFRSSRISMPGDGATSFPCRRGSVDHQPRREERQPCNIREEEENGHRLLLGFCGGGITRG